MICSKADVNVNDVVFLKSSSSCKYFIPGCGVGGHCIPVDPWFLIESFDQYTNLIKTARAVNDSKTEWIYKRVKSEIEFLRNTNEIVNVCILGLTYKKNSDDMRESPALKIAKMLSQDFGEEIYVVEPNVNGLNKDIDSLSLFSLEEALDKCIFIIKLVDHYQFNNITENIDISRHVYSDYSAV